MGTLDLQLLPTRIASHRIANTKAFQQRAAEPAPRRPTPRLRRRSIELEEDRHWSLSGAIGTTQHFIQDTAVISSEAGMSA